MMSEGEELRERVEEVEEVVARALERQLPPGIRLPAVGVRTG